MVRGIYLYTHKGMDLKTSSSSDCGSVRKISPRMVLIARQSRRIVIHETGLPCHLRIRSTMTDLPRVCKFGAFESSHTHIHTCGILRTGTSISGECRSFTTRYVLAHDFSRHLVFPRAFVRGAYSQACSFYAARFSRVFFRGASYLHLLRSVVTKFTT